MSNLWIINACLPPGFQSTQEDPGYEGYEGTWTVQCSNGMVTGVFQTGDSEMGNPVAEDLQLVDARGGLVLPSCGDLITGGFNEAMAFTAKAKQSFPADLDDLYRRGAQLIEESVENGVTSMRAHVEVDEIVRFSCLEVAIKLKAQYEDICYIQIAVFAQEALFENASDVEPGENYKILCQAAKVEGVSAVGSAPYVEPTTEQAKKNIALVFETAMNSGDGLRHIDFHLDYNLNPTAEPLIYEVITQARIYCSSRPKEKASRARPRITIGHATRLQLFSPAEWRSLSASISDLPITLVGLPQSDMYMQGRDYWDDPLGPPRSTLRVPFLEEAYGIKVAMAVNNVDNGFTPQGTLDPLSSLVTFGVAVFQAATPRAIRTLIESVTVISKQAIGLEPCNSAAASEMSVDKGEDDSGVSSSLSSEKRAHAARTLPTDLFPTRGDQADFVILHDNKTLRSVALNPSFERTTIKNGKVIARRQKRRWIVGNSN
ncbi:hypothetical protein AGABI1DRAFT_106927 [Agaricus bisporus var. burnettii JB137-S8]|uniref:Amidohydrolase 3 domain-containing protein n=1 Tax=Agaricus bisporus var. burnettii (strain JB137-S8 / ATCC MYA-4627 / FGSC 10392) TaxID=597362 RepID=K5WVD8_AGABU|nr:uncharacterized protein AGABI1DRAFT_106927 [Agaricus bisporus var. burnettii JB137-S8]EKM79446.1 hypothetical protein AGABI1DRAFT_106927 [Agaricus bisporus var. burnettii JB137-S8]